MQCQPPSRVSSSKGPSASKPLSPHYMLPVKNDSGYCCCLYCAVASSFGQLMVDLQIVMTGRISCLPICPRRIKACRPRVLLLAKGMLGSGINDHMAGARQCLMISFSFFSIRIRIFFFALINSMFENLNSSSVDVGD